MTKVPSPPIPSCSDVAEQILDLILRACTATQCISIEELVSALRTNSSLPTIRQALALLQRDGILQPEPDDSYSVRYLTRREAKEIVELRAETQKLVVRKLAARAVGERLNHAKEILLVLGQSHDDGVAFLKLERQLWSELARAGGFLFATQSLARWSDQLRVFRAAIPLRREEAKLILDALRTLIEKIEQQDACAAMDAISTQVRVASARL